ncbi:MAG: class I SAM-dependent methyltransferase [Acidobacteriota bacterium]
MGITRGSARLLLDEAARRPFSGSLLELARMFVYLRPKELERWARRHGVELSDVETVGRSHDPRLRRYGCLDDKTFFQRLGFDQVTSVDVVDWEGVDVLHDLNTPLPDSLRERFDVVYDGGTLQHVFDLPRALENVHAALKVGGRVVHGMAPSNNHVDLGFYMFSPTLFADFYAANGWRLEGIRIFEYVSFWVRGVLHTGPWKVYRYTPGVLDHLSYGRFGNRQLGIFVVATKTAESTGDVRPQQSFYRDLWRRSDDGVPTASTTSGRDLPLPFALLKPWKRVRETIRRVGPKRMPPVDAVY